MRIEILCTGDEILSGKTINTNYGFIAKRLLENGFMVEQGVVIGDDRQSLVCAFKQAAKRADIVLVNGGLGPTIDDLSQEVAAQAAGVALALNQDWLDRISDWYQARGREMPENNQKQAMLPEGAELIDNPIGTACGFALDIGTARFFFTPGVPKEMRRMINDQIIPRLQAMRGYQIISRVKRFHTFGIGESRADGMLKDIEQMANDGSVKLGFQSHYPQLEIKLAIQGEAIQGEGEQVLNERLAPIEDAMRDILGNFIIAEDDDTLQGLVVHALADRGYSLSIAEMGTAGNVAGRLMSGTDHINHVKGCYLSTELTVLSELLSADLNHTDTRVDLSAEQAKSFGAALLQGRGVTHALVVLTEPSQDPEDNNPSSNIVIAICDKNRTEIRQAQLWGNPDWVCAGATELALDCLRRYLYGLPVQEQIDFEQH